MHSLDVPSSTTAAAVLSSYTPLLEASPEGGGSGLVLCAKSGTRHIGHSLFPAPEVVGIAAAGLRAESGALAFGGVTGSVLADAGLSEGPRWFVEVSPGSVQISSADLARGQRAGERQHRRHVQLVDAQKELALLGVELPASIVDWSAARDWAAAALFRDKPNEYVSGDMGILDVEQLPGGRRIVDWSGKSRANMVRRLVSLDYGPLLAQGPLAMVTLTYPGDWQSVAPSSAACTDHIALLRMRFRKRWGRSWVGPWKREFQGRGAPHYHFLMSPPGGKGGSRLFMDWLSKAWAEVVNHPDLVQRMKHERAGTGVDWYRGQAMTDPKRVAVYFAKHGVLAGKEYQNTVPRLWVDGGESVGRFWGVWGLKPAVVAVPITGDQAQDLVRLLRRWSAAGQRAIVLDDGSPLPVDAAHLRIPVRIASVPRKHSGVDVETGEVQFRRYRKRKVRRRIHRMRGRAGFISVNDGPAAAMMMTDYLSWLNRLPGV